MPRPANLFAWRNKLAIAGSWNGCAKGNSEKGGLILAPRPVLTDLRWRQRSGIARWRKRWLLLGPGAPQRKQCLRRNIAGEGGRWRIARSAARSSRHGGRTLGGPSPPAFWIHRLTS